MMTETIQAGARFSAKNRREVLRQIEELRLAAGELMRDVFPSSLKRYALPQLPETTINKARNAYVCGAFFRAGLYILALRLAGADRARAQRLIDWLQEKVDRWWGPAEPLTDEELEAESRAEQKIDTAEDIEQHDVGYRVPGSERRWLARLQERHARDGALIPRLAARVAAAERTRRGAA